MNLNAGKESRSIEHNRLGEKFQHAAIRLCGETASGNIESRLARSRSKLRGHEISRGFSEARTCNNSTFNRRTIVTLTEQSTRIVSSVGKLLELKATGSQIRGTDESRALKCLFLFAIAHRTWVGAKSHSLELEWPTSLHNVAVAVE